MYMYMYVCLFTIDCGAEHMITVYVAAVAKHSHVSDVSFCHLRLPRHLLTTRQSTNWCT